MRVVLTEGASPLAVTVRQVLASTCGDVALLDMAREACYSDALARCQVLVHLPCLLLDGEGAGPAVELEQLDQGPRRFVSLLHAGVAQGVQRVVCLSSLSLYARYPADCNWSEAWRPKPPAKARSLGIYMGELALREFTRQHRISGVCLRVDDERARHDANYRTEIAVTCAKAVTPKAMAPYERLFACYHVRPCPSSSTRREPAA